MTNLLVIEDSAVKAMLIDPRITNLLPCLATAKRQLESIKKGKRNCQRCKAEKSKIANDAVNQAKTCLRSLQGSSLTKLKNLLGARKLRIIARNARGQRVKYTL